MENGISDWIGKWGGSSVVQRTNGNYHLSILNKLFQIK